MTTPAAELFAAAPSERELLAAELGEHVLLAIDTSLGTSVALGYAGRIFEVSSDDARGHAEAIGSVIARAFELAGAPSAAVTGVVAGIGPGPFTGLRVGIAAAHAFAVGRGVPLLPVQGHEAVALAILESGAAAPEVRVVQDAKRRELFVTDYAGLNWAGVPQRLSDPRLETRADYLESPADVWPERIPAARLVQLAARKLVAGAAFEPDRALYLRAPDVKPAAAVKRVSA
ncbi:tRNA (adenosine(37)-N6)-threonylcarbamoyltransferase complex dimerization subunit type 1 TsaB [Leucobacter sp. UT-8R-CII-1-4]|uniref:tRNA (adenosine(37)-N6)-threonylcarbamoyltransferase complex dimerization subunit type 1 TsaB n=1 Tax=Leucobacter sp. UT-8R-CII-1-4 TaxID=3040075 RepID=UPI0024A91034|nr:tRNA (adenosine(37)-N6)-threonylcarbamoyltransferase complex dimerization subunit type 1 TsaB [Leucobacter sp. UT-8R-CII-1-4]MDI6022221.1 tRNA (adenosine(37)-N6)-threonylcarbamoyltransferase complex dimerization subunit type 1 TsaB [Leucobacter sp. UT-8R-CII-1-4]